MSRSVEIVAEITCAQLKSFLEKKQREVESWLERFLPAKDSPPQVLHRAMRYSVFAGGKRIRPILTILTFEACKIGRAHV